MGIWLHLTVFLNGSCYHTVGMRTNIQGGHEAYSTGGHQITGKWQCIHACQWKWNHLVVYSPGELFLERNSKQCNLLAFHIILLKSRNHLAVINAILCNFDFPKWLIQKTHTCWLKVEAAGKSNVLLLCLLSQEFIWLHIDCIFLLWVP